MAQIRGEPNYLLGADRCCR